MCVDTIFCVLLPVPHTDQTPTPTRFLQNCEEVGLFKEIEEEFLQEQEEEKNKEVHLSKESESGVTEIQEEVSIYALFP